MKAPRELTEAFKEGVDERYEAEISLAEAGEWPGCWLTRFDRGQRPCEGRFERFHYIPRQRVESAVAYLASEVREQRLPQYDGEEVVHDPAIVDYLLAWTAEIPLLAAWDSRNGGIACEAHHRRFDKHLVSVPSEQVVVPYSALPEHVLEFASDWGLEDELTDRFPESEAA